MRPIALIEASTRGYRARPRCSTRGRATRPNPPKRARKADDLSTVKVSRRIVACRAAFAFQVLVGFQAFSAGSDDGLTPVRQPLRHIDRDRELKDLRDGFARPIARVPAACRH